MSEQKPQHNADPRNALDAAQQRQAAELAELFKSFDKKEGDSRESSEIDTSQLTPAGPDPAKATSPTTTSEQVATPETTSQVVAEVANTTPNDSQSVAAIQQDTTPQAHTTQAPQAAWSEVIDNNPPTAAVDKPVEHLSVPVDLLDRLMAAASLVPETPLKTDTPARLTPSAAAQAKAIMSQAEQISQKPQPKPTSPSPSTPPTTPPTIDLTNNANMAVTATADTEQVTPEPAKPQPTTPTLPHVELAWEDDSHSIDKREDDSKASQMAPFPQVMLPASEDTSTTATDNSGRSHTMQPRTISDNTKATATDAKEAKMPDNKVADNDIQDHFDRNDGPTFILPMYPSAMPFLGRFLPQSNPTHMGLNQAHTELHKFLQHLQQINWNGYLHVALGDQSSYALLFEGRIVGAAVAHAVNEEALGEMMNLYDQGANLSAHPLSISYAHILSGVGSRAWKLAPTQEFTGVYAKPAGSAFYMEGEVIAVSSVSLPYEGSFPATLRPKTISLPRSHARWAHIQYVLTLKGKDALNPITDTNMDFRGNYGDKGVRFLRSISQGVMPVDYASRSDLILHELEPMVHAWVQGGYMRDRDEV